MMQWFNPDFKKPEQGMKILCLDRGDFYVAQRMGEFWFSIPFHDAAFSRYFQPEKWQYIDFPDGLTGRLICIHGEKQYNFDELQKEHPDIFEEIMLGMKALFDDGKGRHE